MLIIGLLTALVISLPAAAVENDISETARQKRWTHFQIDKTVRLEENKLRVCERREQVINNILGRIAKRGQKHLDLFTTIAERVQAFYEEKGKVLDNYDELVAEVNNKKATAQTVVDEVEGMRVEFQCDGTDPKGVAASFKDALKSEIEALKAYRKAVRNLIVGVKSVQGTTSSDENSQGDSE